jgi:polysaccharide export outer membrane protein
MRQLKTFFVYSLVILLSAIVIAVPSSVAAQVDYILGPEDILDVIVWGHDDLKREIPVSLEGNISFPLIGEVRAAGITTQQLEKNIAAKLSDGYIIDPQVTVTVKEYRSQKFFITGEVEKPGRYDLEPGTTVLMAISIGGGLTEKAAPNRTRIKREENGEKMEFKVDMDTPVKPNDTIIVPESFF